MKFTDFLKDQIWSCALSFDLSNASQIAVVQENQLNEVVGHEIFICAPERVCFLNNHKIPHKRRISLIFRPMKLDRFLFRKCYHALFESQYSWNTDRKSKWCMSQSPNFWTLPKTLAENLSIGNLRTLWFIGRSIAALKAQNFSFNWQQSTGKSDVHIKIYSHLAGNFSLHYAFFNHKFARPCYSSFD